MNTAINYWVPDSDDTGPGNNHRLPNIVVVGAGPVGVRFIDELKRRNVQCKLTLFGNEPYDLYNRVQLSNVLSRNKDYADIVYTLPPATDDFVLDYQQQHVRSIAPDHQRIETQRGEQFHYDHLVLATGSNPHIPAIEGCHLAGVFTFRNLRDTETLMARIFRSRRIVVVGGGLLGLEAARALSRHRTEVVLVQQSDRLMNRQLDAKAAAMLENYVTAQGIEVLTDSGVLRVLGDDRVTGVTTRSGATLACDSVLFCTGIKPEISLALEAGIKVGRGIKVNDHLQTSRDNIYAIGECCEHNDMVYGIVSPGLEQASVLADHFAHGQSTYQGTQTIATLKVVGQSVCSMGEVAEVTDRPGQKRLSFTDKKSGIYRKLVIHRGKIIGACAIGEWEESRRVQEAFLSHGRLYPWQRLWFKLTGRLWTHSGNQQVGQWPEAALICQCNHITRGAISAAIAQGCESVADIGEKTTAGTVCGSCQPLLQNLLGGAVKPVAVVGAIPILTLSILAIIAAFLFVFYPGVSPVDSVQTPSFDHLWTDGFWKQVSGFSMVGIITLGLVMSLRKRARWTFLGNFAHWRLVHILLGVLALGVLLAHTGAHLGENLNRWLMMNFLLVSAMGALAGITLSWAGKTSMVSVRAMKKGWFWAHVLVTFPLPALLITHIVSVYYY